MSETLPMAGKLPRRRFLGSAAVVTLSVGMGEALRPRKATAKLASGALSVAFWDGTSLVPAPTAGVTARSVVPRDATATTRRVQVKVSAPTCTNAYGESVSAAALQAVNAYFPVVAESKTGAKSSLPFYAWTAAPQGRPAISFPMPLDATDGLTLAIESGVGEALCRFTTGGEKGAVALSEGTYVIAVGCDPSWILCGFDPSENSQTPLTQRTRRGFVPVSFDYVLVTVSFAGDSTVGDTNAPIAA